VRNWFFNSKKVGKNTPSFFAPITFFIMPTKAELTHYRLQAMLRENTFKDLEYLGDLPDKGHTYRIGDHEVPVEWIDELEGVEEEDDAI